MCFFFKGRTQIQYQAQWTSNNSNISPKTFYENIIIDIDEILKQVNISIEEKFQGKNVIILKPNDTICENEEKILEPKPYYYNGECFGNFACIGSNPKIK